MKIVVMTNDGKVIDSYEGIEWWDARAESIFWQALTTWLLRTIARQRPPEAP